MRRTLSLSLFTAMALFGASSAHAAPLGIAAVVDDQVISTVDVDDRMRFVIATAHLSDTPETKKRLAPQIIRQLIDEKLQMQEAVRIGVTVSNDDLAGAIAAIEQRQGNPPGALIAQLERWGIPKETFLNQIRTQLAWTQVITRKIRPGVQVSDQELELARLQPTSSAMGGTEVRVAVLSLPVDKPENEQEVYALAEKLAGEIRAGANFDDIVRNFGAGDPPPPLWVPLDALEPGIARVLKTAEAGAISTPVRTPDGYTILKLLDRRTATHTIAGDSELLLKNILFKMENDDSAEEAKLMLEIARDIARHPGNCKEATIAGISNPDQVDTQVNFIHTKLSELAEPLQQIIASLSVGAVSEPFATDDGIRMFMLCERIDAPPGLASVEETYARLMNRKLELEVHKYMRNLRREAFVEVRD